ncbi:MAG: hypothetical protein K9W44_02940 [Candidatus Lokiarchaeota archaeon]|nr:hypothetical protein [Candidatus Harpocratesius repetitus]
MVLTNNHISWKEYSERSDEQCSAVKAKCRWADELDIPVDEILLRIRYEI